MTSPAAVVPTANEPQIRALLGTGMVVFVITVVIGILNGLDVVDFGHDTILTHVHAGTIGWITLSVFSFTLWIMARSTPGSAGLAMLAMVSVPIYVLAFWSGVRWIMAIAGTAVLITVYGFFVYALSAYRTNPRTTPRLAMVAALLTLSIGSTLGVLIQIQRAIDADILPGEAAIGGHASAQVVGYLVLVGMALAEWGLMPDAPLTKPAITQVSLLFVGGLLTSVGSLTESEALLGAFMPLEVIAMIIFLARVGRSSLSAPWTERSEERHFALLVPFLVVNVALLIYLVAGLIGGRYDDFGAIPPWLVFAFDHAMFIGVMTNGIFALHMVLRPEGVRRYPWSYDVAFYGMNLGLIGFVVGLLLDSSAVKRLSSPVMGLSILAVLAVLALAHRAPEGRAPEPVRAV